MKRAMPSLASSLLMASCSLWLAAAPSYAQSRPHETVVIEGKNVLEGIWRFPPFWGTAQTRGYWTKYGPVPIKGVAWFNRGQEAYCRIGAAEPEFTVGCFGFSVGEKGHTTLDEYGNVHLSSQSCGENFSSCGWRNYWVFRGRLLSNTELSGHIGLVHDGLVDEQPERLTVTKLALSNQSPDLGGQGPFLKELLEEMASGKVTQLYVKQRLFSSNPNVVPIPAEWQQSQQLVFLTPDSLRPLGKILAVIYVGDYIPIWGWRKDLTESYVYSNEQSNIYDVEFEHGERLCALHRRPDGVLNHFRCI